MLQWNDGSWEHRAYWGANHITGWGVDGTESRRYMGPLPVTGQWVRLEVAASQVGLEGRTLGGMALTLHGGRATWDRAGKAGAAAGGGASNIEWLVTDQLGTPRMVVDETGTLAGVKRHDYLPFGEELGAGTGGRTTSQGYSQLDGVRMKFTGAERDDETGLDFMQARYYTSAQGRFTSVDPYNIILETQSIADIDPEKAQAKFLKYLSLPQQWNRYAYVTNNPLKYIDPTGEKLELTGTWEEVQAAFKRLQEMLGPKGANRIFLAQDSETKRYYVEHDGNLATASLLGAHVERMIDDDKTTEFKIATKFDTKKGHFTTAGGLYGGAATIGANESLTGNTQIFVHPDAGGITTWNFSTTVLGRGKSSDGRQLDFYNDIVDAHEFGHAYVNMILGYPPKSPAGDKRSIDLENEVRARRGLPNRRARH